MSTISAGTTLSTALVSAGDTSGELVLKTNGSTPALTIDAAQNVDIVGSLTAKGLTYPTTDGSSGQVIQTNGSGTLSFANATSLASPLAVVGNSTAGAEIRLPEDTDNGSNYVALKAANSLASNLTFTLPSADGTSGQLLQTNGSGTLSFTDPTSLASPLAVVGNSTAGAEIRLPEDTDNGSNYVALKAANSLASNLTFTLPSADGTSGQVLSTNGSGTLSFTTISGGMVIYTANGSSVPAGNGFLLSSTSAVPSGWTFNGAGSGFSTPSGQIWVGLFNSRWQNSAFTGGQVNHGNGGTAVYLFVNGGSNAININLDSYLPVILFRLQ